MASSRVSQRCNSSILTFGRRLMYSIYRIQDRGGVTRSIQIMRTITANADEADTIHPYLIGGIKLLPEGAMSCHCIHFIDRNRKARPRADQQRAIVIEPLNRILIGSNAHHFTRRTVLQRVNPVLLFGRYTDE